MLNISFFLARVGWGCKGVACVGECGDGMCCWSFGVPGVEGLWLMVVGMVTRDVVLTV